MSGDLIGAVWESVSGMLGGLALVALMLGAIAGLGWLTYWFIRVARETTIGKAELHPGSDWTRRTSDRLGEW